MGIILIITSLFSSFIGSFIKFKWNIFTLISFLTLWIIMGGNNFNPDYYNYLRWYSEIESFNGFYINGKDIGYRFLMNVAVYLNFSYQTFVILVSAIGFFLILKSLKFFEINSSFILLFYMIFPFMLDVVQLRNFLMMSIILYAIKFLKYNNKNNLLKFLFTIIIATTIHSAAILYLPLILVRNLESNRIKILALSLSSILFSVIVFVNGNSLPYFKEFLSLFVDNEQILSVFNSSTNLGFILSWMLHIFLIIIMHFANSYVSFNSSYTDSEKRTVKIFYWIFVIGVIWFPFYMISIEFSRVYRNLLILIYMTFFIILKNNNLNILFRWIIIIGMLLFTISLFFLQIYIPHNETVILPILNNNIFWENE